MIAFYNVTKELGGRKILHNVNLEVERGETLVIVGLSGAGKSVTLKHMVGLMDPDSGRVEVDGCALSPLNRNQIRLMRSNFGMLFQGAALLQWLSVYDNVALPMRQRTKMTEEQIRERVEERLDWVGLAEAASQLPAQLSGGMQKRVGLARATIMNPESILYDEPTSGLDPLTSRKMDELIRKINQQMHTTSVVVTHDMISALSIGSRILMLHEGEVVACDKPSEFVKSDVPIVQEFLKAQQVTNQDGEKRDAE